MLFFERCDVSRRDVRKKFSFVVEGDKNILTKQNNYSRLLYHTQVKVRGFYTIVETTV